MWEHDFIFAQTRNKENINCSWWIIFRFFFWWCFLFLFLINGWRFKENFDCFIHDLVNEFCVSKGNPTAFSSICPWVNCSVVAGIRRDFGRQKQNYLVSFVTKLFLLYLETLKETLCLDYHGLIQAAERGLRCQVSSRHLRPLCSQHGKKEQHQVTIAFLTRIFSVQLLFFN